MSGVHVDDAYVSDERLAACALDAAAPHIAAAERARIRQLANALYTWLNDQAEADDAIGEEYAMQGDELECAEYRARADAYRIVQNRIEKALADVLAGGEAQP